MTTSGSRSGLVSPYRTGQMAQHNTSDSKGAAVSGVSQSTGNLHGAVKAGLVVGGSRSASDVRALQAQADTLPQPDVLLKLPKRMASVFFGVDDKKYTPSIDQKAAEAAEAAAGAAWSKLFLNVIRPMAKELLMAVGEGAAVGSPVPRTLRHADGKIETKHSSSAMAGSPRPPRASAIDAVLARFGKGQRVEDTWLNAGFRQSLMEQLCLQHGAGGDAAPEHDGPFTADVASEAHVQAWSGMLKHLFGYAMSHVASLRNDEAQDAARQALALQLAKDVMAVNWSMAYPVHTPAHAPFPQAAAYALAVHIQSLWPAEKALDVLDKRLLRPVFRQSAVEPLNRPGGGASALSGLQPGAVRPACSTWFQANLQGVLRGARAQAGLLPGEKLAEVHRRVEATVLGYLAQCGPWGVEALAAQYGKSVHLRDYSEAEFKACVTAWVNAGAASPCLVAAVVAGLWRGLRERDDGQAPASHARWTVEAAWSLAPSVEAWSLSPSLKLDGLWGMGVGLGASATGAERREILAWAQPTGSAEADALPDPFVRGIAWGRDLWTQVNDDTADAGLRTRWVALAMSMPHVVNDQWVQASARARAVMLEHPATEESSEPSRAVQEHLEQFALDARVPKAAHGVQWQVLREGWSRTVEAREQCFAQLREFGDHVLGEDEADDATDDGAAGIEAPGDVPAAGKFALAPEVLALHETLTRAYAASILGAEQARLLLADPPERQYLRMSLHRIDFFLSVVQEAQDWHIKDGQRFVFGGHIDVSAVTAAHEKCLAWLSQWLDTAAGALGVCPPKDQGIEHALHTHLLSRIHELRQSPQGAHLVQVGK
ncbi:MAG TPA: hypothetical protein VLJ86_08550 [Ramlibacter sp.]|nr:hypothetical protein [Ramlibacter sp.]